MHLRYPFGVIHELQYKKTKTVLLGPSYKFINKLYFNYHSILNSDCVWWKDKTGYDFCGRNVFNENRKINNLIDINDMYKKGSRQL